ncbi:MAG: hypothetical protein KDD22_01165, partial [Bdellovibrionales bacterium]|nr:hypothetical protein [Bdellovibrionales bacterium]
MKILALDFSEEFRRDLTDFLESRSCVLHWETHAHVGALLDRLSQEKFDMVLFVVGDQDAPKEFLTGCKQFLSDYPMLVFSPFGKERLKSKKKIPVCTDYYSLLRVLEVIRTQASSQKREGRQPQTPLLDPHSFLSLEMDHVV